MASSRGKGRAGRSRALGLVWWEGKRGVVRTLGEFNATFNKCGVVRGCPIPRYNPSSVVLRVGTTTVYNTSVGR